MQYISAILQEEGTVLVDGNIQDMATAEICRGLLWHWINTKRDVPGIGALTSPLLGSLLDSKFERTRTYIMQLCCPPTYHRFITDVLLPS